MENSSAPSASPPIAGASTRRCIEDNLFALGWCSMRRRPDLSDQEQSTPPLTSAAAYLLMSAPAPDPHPLEQRSTAPAKKTCLLQSLHVRLAWPGRADQIDGTAQLLQIIGNEVWSSRQRWVRFFRSTKSVPTSPQQRLSTKPRPPSFPDSNPVKNRQDRSPQRKPRVSA